MIVNPGLSLGLARRAAGYLGSMTNQRPDAEEMQERVDELGEDIEETAERAEEPKLDLPEVTQDRTLKDPEGDGEPTEGDSAMTG